MTEQTWIELAKYFGIPIAMFLYILRAGHKQDWCWKRELTEMTTERNFWRHLALTQLNLLEKAAIDREGSKP